MTKRVELQVKQASTVGDAGTCSCGVSLVFLQGQDKSWAYEAKPSHLPGKFSWFRMRGPRLGPTLVLTSWRRPDMNQEDDEAPGQAFAFCGSKLRKGMQWV